jgi:BlaI family transcriptional regulator, penicillinase repressor
MDTAVACSSEHGYRRSSARQNLLGVMSSGLRLLHTPQIEIPMFKRRYSGRLGPLQWRLRVFSLKNFLACSLLLYVTVCNTMASNTHDPAELGELEREILSIVWRLGSVTAEQAREELDRTLKDSTVRTVLRRLEEKGSRQKVAGRAVKRIVDWFCEGSVEALLVGMVDSKVLDQAELQRLATRISEAQKQSGNRVTSGENKRRPKDDLLTSG